MSVAQLDPALLKPGHKATVPSKHSQPRSSVDDSTDDDGDRSDDAEQKRRLHSTARPYKVQHKLDELGEHAGELLGLISPRCAMASYAMCFNPIQPPN